MKRHKNKQKRIVAVCMMAALGITLPILAHAGNLPPSQAQSCANTESGKGYGSQDACCEAACEILNPDQNGNHTQARSRKAKLSRFGMKMACFGWVFHVTTHDLPLL